MFTRHLSIVLLGWLLPLADMSSSGGAIVLQGKVIDARSNKPLSKVHVYVVRGEEEALTDNQGRFRIQSWQSLPLKISAGTQGFQTTALPVKDPSKELVIRLEKE